MNAIKLLVFIILTYFNFGAKNQQPSGVVPVTPNSKVKIPTIEKREADVFLSDVFFFVKKGDWFLQKEVNLVRKIEEVVGKQMEEFECKEKEALADITQVLHFSVGRNDLNTYTSYGLSKTCRKTSLQRPFSVSEMFAYALYLERAGFQGDNILHPPIPVG